MRTLIAAGALAAGLTAAPAQESKPQTPTPATKASPRPKKAEPTLKVGDKAPALKADTWLQGEEVKGFEAGKVYVVEFWQTWCGPCIVAMPHLADLAEEYKPKGVTVIGFAGVLGGDTPAKVAEFVQKKGPKLGYTFAGSDDKETTDAWMVAAGRNGIPCSFVVDKAGTIAYIGHPMTLDPVLPKVVAGTWDPAKADEVLAAFQKDQRAVMTTAAARTPSQAAEALKKLDKLTADRPELAGAPGLAAARLQLLARAEKYTEAAAAAERLIGKAVKRDDGNGLAGLVATLTAAKGQPALGKLAVKAADANLKIAGDKSVSALLTAQTAYAAAGESEKAKAFADTAVELAEKTVKNDKDWQGNLRLAGAYKAAGEADKAKAAAQKAVDAAPEQAKQFVGQQAKQYGAEPKDDGDKKDK